MDQGLELNKGDACPACGGELRAARVPSDEEFHRAFDKENPVSLPPGADTAHPRDRAKLGDLFRCHDCGYTTRFAHEDAGDADQGAATREKSTTRRK